MLSKTIQDALNNQVQVEFESAFLYLSMAAHCAAQNLPGFARWMTVQYQEETGHARKLIDFINDRGGRMVVPALAKPPATFDSPLAVFELTLGHERKVTAAIHRLYELALKEKDYASQVFLQWFVSEQVEEEKNASEIVEQLKVIGDKPGTIIYLDRQLGKRGQ